MRIPIASWILQDWQGPTSNVKLRITADSSFVARDNDDTGVEVDASPAAFREVDCTVGTATIDGLVVKTITIPALWLFSTDDAIVNRRATYSARFVGVRGREISTPQFLQSIRIFKDLVNLSNPVPWHEVIRANNPAAPIPADKETYSTTQILDLIGLAGVGGGGTGNVVAGPNAALNRVAFWTDPTTIDGSGRFVYDNANARLTLGFPGSIKGKLSFTNALNLNTQALESADTPASAIVFKLPAADPSTGNSLRVASFSAGVAILEWSNPPGGGGGGSGDVVGPGSSTDNAVARFDLATGKIIQNSLVTLSDAGAFSFPDDVRQIFNPGVNAAGLNVGAIAGDVVTPVNGDLWYDSTNNLLRARINGANVSLGAGGGGGTGDVVGPASATDNAVARFDLATGKLIQNSAVTIADTTGDMAGVGTINTHTIPGGTGTFALVAASQTLTNKTISGPTNILGGVTMTLGGDANGDIYFRSSNVLTRLAIGSPGQVLGVSGGNLPTWQSGGTGDVVGPASSTDNALARFDLATGKLIQSSVVIVADTTGAFTVPATWTLNDNNGNEIFRIAPVAAAINEWTFGNSDAGNPITATATGGDTNITVRVAPKGAGVFESTAPLTLSGTGLSDFITPTASTIPTKINIPLFTPPAFSQIIALGLNTSAPSSCRVITVADQRGPGHQPSIALLSPDETNIFGLSWDGSNAVPFLVCTNNQVGVQGGFRLNPDSTNNLSNVYFSNAANEAYFGQNGTITSNVLVSATPANYTLNGQAGTGTNIGGANLMLAGGRGTGTGAPGYVVVRYPLLTTTGGTTLQGLSSVGYPVNTNYFSSTNSNTLVVQNSVTATNYSTVLTGSDESTRTILANSVYLGTTFKVHVRGSYEATGTPTIQFNFLLGGVNVGNILVSVAAGSSGNYTLDVDIHVVALSGTSVIIGATATTGQVGAPATTVVGAAFGGTIAFSSNQDIDVQAQWSVANAANILRVGVFTIDRIR